MGLHSESVEPIIWVELIFRSKFSVENLCKGNFDLGVVVATGSFEFHLPLLSVASHSTHGEESTTGLFCICTKHYQRR